MNIVPKRLKKEPLIEVIWQVQFEGNGAGDALPGILYDRLRKNYVDIRLQRLPAADIPAAVAQTDPNLLFAAKVRLESADTPFLWQIGERVATLNCRKPYVGWKAFKDEILDLMQTLESSGLVSKPHGHSLRYINLMTIAEPPDLSPLQMNMQLGEYSVKKLPLKTRLELPDGEYLHVVQIATPAQVQLPEGKRNGSVVDIETYATKIAESWAQAGEQLDTLHERSKRLFFEHLLTAEAIEVLEPEY